MPPEPNPWTPAQLGFIAIYNPSLGDEDSPGDQIIYYRSPSDRQPKKKRTESTTREQKNKQLRRIGLAQGMIDFGKTFSNGEPVESVETEKSRILVRELEDGWWILVVSRSYVIF